MVSFLICSAVWGLNNRCRIQRKAVISIIRGSYFVALNRRSNEIITQEIKLAAPSARKQRHHLRKVSCRCPIRGKGNGMHNIVSIIDAFDSATIRNRLKKQRQNEF